MTEDSRARRSNYRGAAREAGRDHPSAPMGPGDGAATRQQDWDFRLIVDGMSDAIIVSGDENRVLYANSATRNLLGWAPEELIGRSLTAVVPERLRRQHVRGFQRFIATGLGPLIGRPVRLPALHADGSEVEVELTINAFTSAAGNRLIVGSLRDVSERITLERESAVTRDLLLVVAEAASLREATTQILQTVTRAVGWDAAALWLVDAQTDVLRCLECWVTPARDLSSFARETRRIALPYGTGLPGRVWASRRPAWISDVVADPHFPRAGAAQECGLHAGFAFPIEAEGEVLGVVELFDGEVREPDDKLLVDMASLGKPLGGFLARRRAEDEIAFQRSLLAAEGEVTLDGMLVVAPSGKVTYYNQRFVEMWRLPEAVVATQSEFVLLRHILGRVADPHGFLTVVREVQGHPEGSFRDEVHLDDGTVLDRYTAPLQSPAGRDYGRVWYFRDVTQERQAERELEDSRQKFANMATALQQSLLPAALPNIEGLDLAACYRPAGAGIDVGGDFYDVFATGEGEWGLMVGDVSGKGPHAAAVTALLRHTARAVAMSLSRPERILASVNDAMWAHDLGERFCTAAYVRLLCKLQGAEVTVSRAGHPPPLLVTSSGAITSLGAPSTPLGVVREIRLEDQTVGLEPGDCLVLYTDGVVEAGAPDKELGDAGLADLLRNSVPASASELVATIETAVLDREGGIPRDDIAIVVLRREPSC